MQLNKSDIEALPKIKRLNIINSVTGIKPANLIGTVSDDGHPNLAIFSSVVHLGSHPALLGFMLRPNQHVRRDTYENILQNGCYTINHVPEALVQQAHYTSAKFEQDQSEFEYCQFTEWYFEAFKAPFVKEAQVKIGLSLLETVEIKANNTMMIIGAIEHLFVPDHAVSEDGHIDLDLIETAGISGLNSYYSLKKLTTFPYARANELPEFEK